MIITFIIMSCRTNNIITMNYRDTLDWGAAMHAAPVVNKLRVQGLFDT